MSYVADVVYCDEETGRKSKDLSDILPKPRHSLPPLPGGGPAAQLTGVGMQGSYDLGLRLASRYGALLDGTSPTVGLVVRSTRVPRTCQTAQCVLGGLLSSHPAGEVEVRPNSRPRVDGLPGDVV